MGVRFVGKTAITLTPVGAAKFKLVKSPLGRGPVARVEFSRGEGLAGQFGEQGKAPDIVILHPWA